MITGGVSSVEHFNQRINNLISGFSALVWQQYRWPTKHTKQLIEIFGYRWSLNVRGSARKCILAELTSNNHNIFISRKRLGQICYTVDCDEMKKSWLLDLNGKQLLGSVAEHFVHDLAGVAFLDKLSDVFRHVRPEVALLNLVQGFHLPKVPTFSSWVQRLHLLQLFLVREQHHPLWVTPRLSRVQFLALWFFYFVIRYME